MAKPLSINGDEEDEDNYCYKCQADGHKISECPQMQCVVCHQYGHTKFSKLCRATIQAQPSSPTMMIPEPDDQPVVVPSVEINVQYCAICQEESSHDTGDCPNKRCQHCSEIGHIKLDCEKYKNEMKNKEASPLSKIKIRTDLYVASPSKSTKPDESPASNCSYHVVSSDSYKPVDSDRDMDISDGEEVTPKVEEIKVESDVSLSNEEDSQVKNKRKRRSSSPSPPPRSEKSGTESRRSSQRSQSPRSSRSKGPSRSPRSPRDMRSRSPGRSHRRFRTPERLARLRSRSHERSKRRSRSHDRSSHRRSRSPDRSKRRSRSPGRSSHRRSRSPGRSHRRSRSHSRSPSRRQSPHRRVRSPPTERSRHEVQSSKNDFQQDLRKYERSQLYDQWKNIIQGSGPSSAPSPNLMPPGAPFNVPPPLMGRLPAVIPTHANLVGQPMQFSVHPSSSPSPPVVPQPVPQPEMVPEETVSNAGEGERLWVKNWWSMKSEYSTACSSLICLKMLPSTWREEQVHDFLQKCGLKSMAHYSHCGFMNVDSGYRSISVQFYNKVIAKHAMMKICTSGEKPEVTEALFQAKPVNQDYGQRINEENELLLSKRVGAPRQRVVNVCFANVIMNVQVGVQVTEMCFTLQDHCLTYVKSHEDLLKFFDSISSLLIESTSSSSASNVLQKAVLVFETKKKASQFFMLAKQCGAFQRLRPLIAQVRVFVNVNDIITLVQNCVSKPPLFSMDTVKDKSIALDDLFSNVSIYKTWNAKLASFSVEALADIELKLVPCFVLVDSKYQGVHIKMKLQGSVSPKVYILTDAMKGDTDLNKEDEEGNTAVITNTNKGIAKVIECLTGWLDSVGGDRLILCTTSQLVISALFKLSKDILDCFAGCVDLMSLLGETIKYDQLLSRAYQPVCLPLEYMLEKYCDGLDPKKIKTSLARLESVFEFHNTLESKELKVAMKPINAADYQHLNDLILSIDTDQKAYGSEHTNLKLQDIESLDNIHCIYTKFTDPEILPIKLYRNDGDAKTYLQVFNAFRTDAIDFQNRKSVGRLVTKDRPLTSNEVEGHEYEFRCCDGVLVRNFLQMSIKTRILDEEMIGLTELSLTLPQFIPKCNEEYQVYFMTFQTITSNNMVIGAKMWLHDLFSSDLSYAHFYVMEDLIHANYGHTLEQIEEQISKKFVEKLLKFLKNACIISYGIVSSMNQLKKWCTRLPGGLTELDSGVKAICDLRWLDKNDSLHLPKSWEKYIAKGARLKSNNFLDGCKTSEASIDVVKILVGEHHFKKEDLLYQHFVGLEYLSKIKSDAIKVKVNVVEKPPKASNQPIPMMVPPPVIPPVVPPVPMLALKNLRETAAKLAIKKMVIFVHCEWNDKHQIHSLNFHLDLENSLTLKQILTRDPETGQTMTPGISEKEGEDKLKRFFLKIQGDNRKFVLCLMFPNVLNYLQKQFKQFMMFTASADCKGWIDVYTLAKQWMNGQDHVWKAPVEDQNILKKIYEHFFDKKIEAGTDQPTVMKEIVQGCADPEDIETFAWKKASCVNFPQNYTYTHIFLHVDVMKHNQEYFVTSIGLLNPYNQHSAFLPIKPDSEHASLLLKTSNWFSQRKDDIWVYNHPNMKKVDLKCQPLKEALIKLLGILEEAQRDREKSKIVVVTLDQLGQGIPILIKSLIEQNLVEAFTKLVYGFHDIRTLMHVSGVAKKVKMEELYSIYNKKEKNLDVFKEGNAKDKAEAAAVLHEAIKKDGVKTVVFGEMLHSPYTTALLHSCKDPLFRDKLWEVFYVGEVNQFIIGSKVTIPVQVKGYIFDLDTVSVHLKLQSLKSSQFEFQSVKKVHKNEILNLVVKVVRNDGSMKKGYIIGKAVIPTSAEQTQAIMSDLIEKVPSPETAVANPKSKPQSVKESKRRSSIERKRVPVEKELFAVEMPKPKKATEVIIDKPKPQKATEERKVEKRPSKPNVDFRQLPEYALEMTKIDEHVNCYPDYKALFEHHVGARITEGKKVASKELDPLMTDLMACYETKDFSTMIEEFTLHELKDPEDVKVKVLPVLEESSFPEESKKLVIEALSFYVSVRLGIPQEGLTFAKLPKCDLVPSDILYGQIICLKPIQVSVKNELNEENIELVNEDVANFRDVKIGFHMFIIKKKLGIPMHLWNNVEYASYGYILKIEQSNEEFEIGLLDNKTLKKQTVSPGKLVFNPEFCTKNLMVGQQVMILHNDSSEIKILIPHVNLTQALLPVPSDDELLPKIFEHLDDLSIEEGFALEDGTPVSLIKGPKDIINQMKLAKVLKSEYFEEFDIELDDDDGPIVQSLCQELNVEVLAADTSIIVAGTYDAIMSFCAGIYAEKAEARPATPPPPPLPSLEVEVKEEPTVMEETIIPLVATALDQSRPASPERSALPESQLIPETAAAISAISAQLKSGLEGIEWNPEDSTPNWDLRTQKNGKKSPAKRKEKKQNTPLGSDIVPVICQPIVENTPLSTTTVTATSTPGLQDIQHNSRQDTLRVAEMPRVEHIHVPTTAMSTPTTPALLQNPKELETARLKEVGRKSTKQNKPPIELINSAKKGKETQKVAEKSIVKNTPVSTPKVTATSTSGCQEIQQNPRQDTSRVAEMPRVENINVPTPAISTPSTSARLQNPEELEIANVGRQQQPPTSTGNMPCRNKPVAALELPDPVRNQIPELTGHFVKLTSKPYHHTSKKMRLINVNESLDEQSFAIVLGYLPDVTLTNTKVDISRMEMFHHFVGPRNNPLKHIRIHFCYHLFNSVFLMIIKGRLAMLKSAHGWMHLNDANFEPKPSQPCLPVEERSISDKLFEQGRSSFSRDKNDEVYASVSPLQVGNVRVFSIPPNLRTRLTEEFNVLIPHYVISTESISPIESTGHIAELEFTLRYICQNEFQDVKSEVEERLQETPHDPEPDSNLEGFITLDDSEDTEDSLVELEKEASSTSKRARKITVTVTNDNKRKVSPTQTAQSSSRKRTRISPPDDSEIIQEYQSTDRNPQNDRNSLCYAHFRYENCTNTARCRKRHRIRDIDYCAKFIQQKCGSQETCPNMLRHLSFNQLQKEWRASLEDDSNQIEYVPTVQQQQAIDGLPIQHSKRDLASRLSDREDLANRLTNRRRNRRSPDLYSNFTPSQPLPIWDRLGPGEEVDLSRPMKTEPQEYREPRQPRNNRPICRYFQEGNCRYGDRCKNEHVQLYDISDEDEVSLSDEDEVSQNNHRNFAFR